MRGGEKSMTEAERADWALDDRAAKIVIGGMLALQALFLLSTMLWL